MRRSMLTAMTAGLLALLLVPAAAAAPVRPDKATGSVWLYNELRGSAYAEFAVTEAQGAPGDPDFRPAGGFLTMTVAGVTRGYVVTNVAVEGNDAGFLAVSTDGSMLHVVAEDNGTPGTGVDHFGTSTGMLVTSWTITSGNLVVHDR